MSQTILDPDELDRFAGQLEKATRGIQDQIKLLTAAHQKVGDTWRDQEKQRFDQEFGQLLRSTGPFIEYAGRQVPVLRKKAELIRQARQIR